MLKEQLSTDNEPKIDHGIKVWLIHHLQLKFPFLEESTERKSILY